ncbi:folylpolyglutamate synthase [Rhinocladiella similis]
MINLGLQRITALLQPLFTAHPASLPWKAIHIAGTNGKGSVAALLSTFLSRSGYSVGRFTSPHLIDRWDCITLNQHVVDRDRFLDVEREMRTRSQTRQIGASDFEILTATAFELFTRSAVDVAVVECGLGGRLDATNALRTQDVLMSVLAKVGLDHTEFLGDTVEKVTWEKAGIFKPGVPVVVDGSNDPEVLSVVWEKLDELGNTHGVHILDGPREELLSQSIDKMRQLGGNLAKHQMQNLTTAWTAYTLAERRLEESKSTSTATSGLTTKSDGGGGGGDWMQNVAQAAEELPRLVTTAQSSLQGRLEWLEIPERLLPDESKALKHKVLIDGAHNPQSACALAAYVDESVRQATSRKSSVTWVLAAKNDKDIRAIVSTLLRKGDNVVTCSFGPVDGMPWVKSMDASVLLEIAGEFVSDESTTEAARDGSVREAIVRALEIAGQGPVCVAGSLYLVGDVLRLVRDG